MRPPSKSCFEYLQIETLIVTGIAANICVLFTANDAYMRDYNILVPGDCVAAILPKRRNIHCGRLRTFSKAMCGRALKSIFAALKAAHPGRRSAPNDKLLVAK